MTRKFDAWAERATARPSTRCTRSTRRCSATRCYPSLADVPGDIDLAIILTGQAVDTFEEVLAPQGEVRGDLRGRVLARPARTARSSNGASRRSCVGRRRPPARPEHEPQRVRGLPRRPRRPVDRARHPVGPPGPPGVPGPGDRHPAHALGADRQRGRPRVRRLRRVLRRPARGRRDRLLHRGLQGRPHADARGRPRGVAAQADRDGEGRAHRRPARSMAQSHTGHLTGSDAITSAVFRQFGVTRVDGLDELLEVSAALARTRPTTIPTGRSATVSPASASTRSPAAPARTSPT